MQVLLPAVMLLASQQLQGMVTWYSVLSFCCVRSPAKNWGSRWWACVWSMTSFSSTRWSIINKLHYMYLVSKLSMLYCKLQKLRMGLHCDECDLWWKLTFFNTCRSVWRIFGSFLHLIHRKDHLHFPDLSSLELFPSSCSLWWFWLVDSGSWSQLQCSQSKNWQLLAKKNC